MSGFAFGAFLCLIYEATNGYTTSSITWTVTDIKDEGDYQQVLRKKPFKFDTAFGYTIVFGIIIAVVCVMFNFPFGGL